MTTGDKTADTLMLSMPEETEKPQIGQSSQAIFAGRDMFISDAFFIKSVPTSTG